MTKNREHANYFKIKKDGHVYEAFIDSDFTSDSVMLKTWAKMLVCTNLR